MECNLRPESFERITNSTLAKKFIDEQVKLVRKQVGDKKVLLAYRFFYFYMCDRKHINKDQ